MSESYLEVDESTFERDVLQRSLKTPVVVDFWAPWCGPCRTLGPILEELAESSGGRWVLVKVHADENPTLTSAYGVRGIPAVKAFVGGRVVDEFTGALPRTAVESFLEKLVPSRAKQIADEAAAAGQSGDRDREKELWSELLAEEPDSVLARIRRARILLLEGQLEQAKSDLEAVPADSELRSEAENLLRLAQWAERIRGRGGLEAIRGRAAADPEDVRARYELGCALAISGDFDGALGEFLEVVRRDRGFEQDAGRVGMLSVFSCLGAEHELTREYRNRLSEILF